MSLTVIFGGLFILLLVLTLSSWLIFRYFRPRHGRMTYVFASLPFALAALAVLGEALRERPNAGPPSAFFPAKIPQLIERLERSGGEFSISGLAYFDGKLYVSTNLGIVVIQNGRVLNLLQFQTVDSVVSGPWVDNANHLLWASDHHTGELLKYDGKQWARTPKPKPEKGYFSRGDAFAGVKPVGNRFGFWMAAAGSAWRWDNASNGWQNMVVKEAAPAEAVGVLPIGQIPMLIVRHEPLSFLVHKGQIFASDQIVKFLGNP